MSQTFQIAIKGTPGVAPWGLLVNWAANTVYSVLTFNNSASAVFYNSSAYYCTTAHTSGSTFDPSKWQELTPGVTASAAEAAAAAASAVTAVASAALATTQAETATTQASNASTSAAAATASATTAVGSASAAAASAAAATTTAAGISASTLATQIAALPQAQRVLLAQALIQSLAVDPGGAVPVAAGNAFITDSGYIGMAQ